MEQPVRQHLRLVDIKGKDLVILSTCPSCKNEKEFTLDGDEFEAWEAGKFIQNAFPELSDADRERIVSGICPECWVKIFGEDEE